MKVAVCTMCVNDWYAEIVKYGVKTIKQYAEKYGYDFYICNEVYDGKRDCPWYKIKAIQKILPDYDYVFWLDADGHVQRPDLSVDFFIQTYMDGKDVLGAQEFNCAINTGVLLVRNTPFVHSLLQLIWDNNEPFDPAFHEQASMAQIYTTNRLNCQAKIKILPIEQQEVLFTYWSNSFSDVAFFFHAARCSSNPCGFICTLDCYCPIPMDEDQPGEYEKRIAWLSNPVQKRKDVEECIRTGRPFNISTRAAMYVRMAGDKDLSEKIANTKLKKNL